MRDDPFPALLAVAASRGGGIRLEDIPFPSQEQLQARLARTQDHKHLIKELLRRWHPDKFSARFGGDLEALERDAILEKVNEVFLAISHIRETS